MPTVSPDTESALPFLSVVQMQLCQSSDNVTLFPLLVTDDVHYMLQCIHLFLLSNFGPYVINLLPFGEHCVITKNYEFCLSDLV